MRLGVNLDIQYRLQVDGGDIQKMMTATDTVLEFMERINRRDAEGLAALMTEDHVFTDSLGQTVRGREKMRAGWKGYFAFCPDFTGFRMRIFSRPATGSGYSARPAARLLWKAGW